MPELLLPEDPTENEGYQKTPSCPLLKPSDFPHPRLPLPPQSSTEDSHTEGRVLMPFLSKGKCPTPWAAHSLSRIQRESAKEV